MFCQAKVAFGGRSPSGAPANFLERPTCRLHPGLPRQRRSSHRELGSDPEDFRRHPLRPRIQTKSQSPNRREPANPHYDEADGFRPSTTSHLRDQTAQRRASMNTILGPNTATSPSPSSTSPRPTRAACIPRQPRGHDLYKRCRQARPATRGGSQQDLCRRNRSDSLHSTWKWNQNWIKLF
jgi:hypothetical protein